VPVPEPIVLILGGVAVYSWLKNRQTAAPTETQLADEPAAVTAGNTPLATIPSGSLATNGSAIATAEGVPIGDVMAVPPPPDGTYLTVPSDLVAALDNQTALMFRAYARLNPDDLEAFLTKYSDRVVLRNDLYFEILTEGPPGADDIQITPGMLTSMGSAAYRVGQALNGVAAGKSVDLFGTAASVAGAIPGVDENLVSSLQGMAMGYRVITSITDVMSVATNAGVEITNLTGLMQLGGAVGAYPGLAALPLSGVLMGVGLVVDIGFTIISDKPDLQKAVDVALDVASLCVLFIPVIGLVIALVIQLVKFIIDLFGEQLFGGGMTKEQKEMIEAAKYGERLNPMYPQLAAAYTPRELWRTIVQWGSGYCGGVHIVAMSVVLKLKAGDTFMVNGSPYTVPPNPEAAQRSGDGTVAWLAFGDNEQPGGCYWFKGTPFERITNDEQAWALGAYAAKNGTAASAQVGVSDYLTTQFEQPTMDIIQARATPMGEFVLKHKLSLDQIDQIALEYRAQPHLNELAVAFGWPTWQEHFGSVVEPEWRAFSLTTAEGSLSDFAKRNGYTTMYAFREVALRPFESLWQRGQAALRTAQTRLLAAQSASVDLYAQQHWLAQSSSAP
jgi:hypothetical protein